MSSVIRPTRQQPALDNSAIGGFITGIFNQALSNVARPLGALGVSPASVTGSMNEGDLHLGGTLGSSLTKLLAIDSSTLTTTTSASSTTTISNSLNNIPGWCACGRL